MSSALPVLTAIRGEWNAIHESPVLGKDVLELLSSSMYVNSLSVYREYIQNAADSIDEAVALGLLARPDDGKVFIRIDPATRSVVIRDNGVGIPQADFVKRLIALGASRKRGRKARGFRGVGRLAGLGYCQELVFRSRIVGEREVSELRWDCKKLKLLLRDPQISDQLGDVISQVVRFRKTVDFQAPEHFFEVELKGLVRNGSDILMNATAVGKYLSKIAPVPFAPQFTFGDEIKLLLQRALPLGSISIYINGAAEPLYRPHRDSFQARKGVTDQCLSVEPLEIRNGNGEVAAVGWMLHHGYQGALSRETMLGGLRLRCGNIQVGEDDLLDALFAEPRFNSWAIGEIHILDERILPNGRRDHFEQNVHFSDLLNRLVPHAHELSRVCRVTSVQRNLARQYESKRVQVEEGLAVLDQGAIPHEQRLRVTGEVQALIATMKKLCSTSRGHTLDPQFAGLSALEVRVAKSLETQKQNTRMQKHYVRERHAYERVFGLIYECSSEQASARALIDQIIRRLG